MISGTPPALVTPSQQQERAFWYVYQRSLADVFGPDTARLKLAHLEGQALDREAVELMFDAVDQGRFNHLEDVKDRLQQHYQGHGRNVPYSEWFAAGFPMEVAATPLAFVEERLAELCARYAERHADYFDLSAGGYQYLRDVLIEARFAKQVADTPSLARALAWLAAQAKAASITYVTADAAWDGVLRNGYAARDLGRLLVQLGLLHGDSHTPVAGTKAGAWIGVVAALQARHLLTRNRAALARALRHTYGAVVSERALQVGCRPDNVWHQRYYQRTCALLAQDPSAAICAESVRF